MTLGYIAERILSRPMRTVERAIVLSAKEDYLDYYRQHSKDAKALIAVGEATANDGLDVASLAAWSMVCNQVMNLDESLNK